MTNKITIVISQKPLDYLLKYMTKNRHPKGGELL